MPEAAEIRTGEDAYRREHVESLPENRLLFQLLTSFQELYGLSERIHLERPASQSVNPEDRHKLPPEPL
jgi:hypothetical protein